MSDGEELLAWQLDQLGIRYLRQVRFHGSRQWRCDFGLQSYGPILVEVDGGTNPFRNKKTGELMLGRHSKGKGFEDDCEKLNEAAILGFRVLRVTPKMVEDGRALQWIERAIGRKAK